VGLLSLVGNSRAEIHSARAKTTTVHYMARPKVYEGKRVTTAVRVPEELHSRLAEAAAEREMSVNYLVVRAVENYLDRLIPADELKLTRD